jgi:hypothetical protein
MLAKQEQGMAKELSELLKLAARRGYEPGWAHNVWRARLRKQQEKAKEHEGMLPAERNNRAEASNAESREMVFNFS